jgi:F0F1-type ATP synthase assembly protein I
MFLFSTHLKQKSNKNQTKNQTKIKQKSNKNQTKIKQKSNKNQTSNTKSASISSDFYVSKLVIIN